MHCEKPTIDTCVMSLFGIANLEISCHDFTPFQTCNKQEVVDEIDTFAFKKFPISWITCLMEDPRFMNDDGTLAQRQFAAFKQCNDAINQCINCEAQKLKFIQHLSFRWYPLD